MADTETLLVLVQSLLDSPRSTEAILDALTQCDGDPDAAANRLSHNSPAKKRRRVDLNGWLKQSPAKKAKESPPDPPASPVASTSRPLRDTKPVTDLMTVLRQPPKTEKTVPAPPPLTLSMPALVAEHTPCTLRHSVLPPELACKLFYTMMDAAGQWSRNKWWLFDRVVESPHRTAFFARRTNGIDDDDSWQEAARFWQVLYFDLWYKFSTWAIRYNGRMTDVPPVFPPEMEEACCIVENLVNEEMKKRHRFPLEWAGGTGGDPGWRANVAASNCYEGGKESVGFHSDHLTYLGPYTTIASLSLGLPCNSQWSNIEIHRVSGTSRVFRLREVIPTEEAKSRRARTFNIPLTHNSLTIMHASCQEKFKHSIPPQTVIDLFRPPFPKSPGGAIEPSNCRINITFRFYRPDFRPNSIPQCKCGVPTILRPDMKNRVDGKTDRYWWTCYAGAQNEGKGCNFWQLLDMAGEGRGPVVADGLQG